MHDTNGKPPTYFCVLQSEEALIPEAFQIGSDLAKLRTWADAGGKEAIDREKNSEEVISPSGDHVLGRLLKKIADSSHHQYDMVMLMTAIKSHFPQAMAKYEIVDKSLAGALVAVQTDNYKIYSLNEAQTSDVVKGVSQLVKTTKGLDQLPDAILLSIVATFDSQMSETVRTMLTVKSDKLRSGQRQVSLSSIMNASSLQEIIDEAVADEVYQFSRFGHDEQVKYIEENFDIEIRKSWKRWPDLIEVFETRNLVAHGEGTYTARYVSICTKHNHKGSDKVLGKQIEITPRYLRQSLNTLFEFSVLLVFSLWRKHQSDDESEAFAALNEVVYELIAVGRGSVAIFISEYALSLKNTAMKEATRLRFVVNLASAQMHMKKEDLAERTLDKVDWTAAADDFKLCVAALRKDINEVVRLIPLVKASRSVFADSFRTWPVFSFIKEDRKFQEAFEDAFGEPYTRKTNQVIVDASAEIGDVDATFGKRALITH
ncbi:hypothetical protein KCP91_15960 [Microvirga sp. SRT01]|uniref:Apea-like HEPN domain-containing protein n=1 Tax=Sphingomonas longa TaxID=2778730 RepID=A0ABS2DAC2_9SPHN|nr:MULTISPECIES: hypothetical protein [Alphaproteobacteria]MBM6577880.1 hypothetical protein [Sphingomonas sp. BT552]MBR7710921.1 hypothetical protein [Microvirga sp. SRT01]